MEGFTPTRSQKGSSSLEGKFPSNYSKLYVIYLNYWAISPPRSSPSMLSYNWLVFGTGHSNCHYRQVIEQLLILCLKIAVKYKSTDSDIFKRGQHGTLSFRL
jgi:hypothetical protein